MNSLLLVDDIGGTKTNLAVFSSEKGPREPLAEATLPSSQYASLEVLVRQFLAEIDLPVKQASIGVDGPAVAGQSTITDLPWRINENRLSQVLDLPIFTL